MYFFLTNSLQLELWEFTRIICPVKEKYYWYLNNSKIKVRAHRLLWILKINQITGDANNSRTSNSPNFHRQGLILAHLVYSDQSGTGKGWILLILMLTEFVTPIIPSLTSSTNSVPLSTESKFHLHLSTSSFLILYLNLFCQCSLSFHNVYFLVCKFCVPFLT